MCLRNVFLNKLKIQSIHVIATVIQIMCLQPSGSLGFKFLIYCQPKLVILCSLRSYCYHLWIRNPIVVSYGVWLSFRFIATLRGHVNRVYQVAWSADSRLLCSGSSDSTLKVWDITKKKILQDLPGHADEVL